MIATQLELGTDPFLLARTDDPDTSHAAAASINTTDLETLVLNAIDAAGPRGMTQDELLAAFPGLSYSSVTARPAALKRKGFVVATDGKRKGSSGRAQTVLVARHHAQEVR